MTPDTTLSDNEREALDLLRRKRSILVSHIDSRTSVDILGAVIPGMGLFRKLIARGLAYQTQEPVLEDGFQFTEAIELTEAGEDLARELAASEPVAAPSGGRRRTR